MSAALQYFILMLFCHTYLYYQTIANLSFVDIALGHIVISIIFNCAALIDSNIYEIAKVVIGFVMIIINCEL